MYYKFSMLKKLLANIHIALLVYLRNYELLSCYAEKIAIKQQSNLLSSQLKNTCNAPTQHDK